MGVDPITKASISVLSKILTDKAKKKLKSNEEIVSFWRRHGYGKVEDDFEILYTHSLVVRNNEGVNESVLEIFREEKVIQAFRQSWRLGKVFPFEEQIQKAVEQLEPGDQVKALSIDILEEAKKFYHQFTLLVCESRTPGDQEDSRRIKEIRDAVVNKELSPEKQEQLLNDYLTSIVVETKHIDIKGISSRPGAGKEALIFPIEDIYTPLKTHPLQRERQDLEELDKEIARQGERVPLTDLLSSSRRLLLIGDPGGGKTTFIKLIACVLAKDVLDKSLEGRKHYLGLPLEVSAPVPIFIRLAALAEEIKSGGAYVGSGASWKYILHTIERIYGSEESKILEGLLTSGGCALLLDGLDEVADEELRNRIVEVVNSSINKWKDNLIILSSRPFGYHNIAGLEDIATAHIDAFGKEEILEFLERWGQGLYSDKKERRGVSYLSELQTAIIDSPPIRKLARNPVMLTCLCVVHWNERSLPEGKADLLSAVLRWLLNAREENRKKRGYENIFAEESFKALAMVMTGHPAGKQVVVDLSWAADQLVEPFRDILRIEDKDRVHRQGMRFLEGEMLDSGIIEKYGSGQLRFWHLSFQEHYAARASVDRSDEEWWGIIMPQLCNQQWTEVLDHLAGCLAWTGRYRLDLLVEKILGTASPRDLASVARAVGVLGRILRILEAYKYQPPVRLAWEEARKQVMDIFTLEGAARVPVEERIAAAEALGQAGDSRIKPLEPEMLPVPDIPGVVLGKYPVTVEEYRRFVENGGYEDRRYWEDSWPEKEKRKWTEPGDWEDQLEHPNRPITDISWYEVVAYCNWLEEQSGLPYRLPIEKEWERAATREKGEYPWGKEEPSKELLNFNDNVGRPTPIGVYPAGAATGGHLDMSGNVLEWVWDSVADGSLRVIRGGGWRGGALVCRSAIRRGGSPGGRDSGIGFRLARSVG